MINYKKVSVVIAATLTALSFAGVAHADDTNTTSSNDTKIVYVPVPGPIQYVNVPVPGPTVYVPVPGPVQYVNVPGPVQYVNVPGPTVTTTITVEKEKVVEKIVKQEIIKNETETSVYFDTSSAKLTYGSRVILDKFIKKAKEKKLTNFDISGYTDSRGGVKGSFDLALNRAESVKKYIAKQIPNAKFNTAGYGISWSYKNNSVIGLQLNRRADIVGSN